MEQLRTNQEEHDPWRDAWDAVPRDGPGVFVVLAEAFDRGEIKGEWVALEADARARRGQLVALAAATGSGMFAIVDQVGLPVLLPEQFGPDDIDEVLGAIGGTP